MTTPININTNTAFAQDVLAGLQRSPKKLPSKYFYDQRGDALFQAIMHMPEYYLTNCELEIFETHQSDILSAIGFEAFQLLELGAGDGYKTKVLLRHFLEQSAEFEYRPIDISPHVLADLEAGLREELPSLQIQSLAGDYFEVLHQLRNVSKLPKVVLFLGANIGNYTEEQAVSFLSALAKELNAGDKLLIGFDLKKDPEIILQAYNDPAGVTAAFNLNLLRRINQELGANFDLQAFRHWESYDAVSGAARSALVSTKEQHVFIRALNRSFHFGAWEAVRVELSQKYALTELAELAKQAGFAVEQHFFDRRQYFADSLWRVT